MSEAARQRTAQAILEAAAHVLAEDAEASLDDVAHAAEVGRATLYRHFPSREALLAALRDEAVEEMGRRLAEASLDRVPVPEAIERIVRATLVVGDRYRFFRHEKPEKLDGARVEARLGGPIRAVVSRGIETGVLRDDVPQEVLLELFGGILQTGAQLVSTGRASIDDATAYTTAFALGGLAR
jgi:AcrR family transcriptional regulator